MCSCLPGYTGSPYSQCYLIDDRSNPSKDPCNPNLCGENSVCKNQNGKAVCSCKNGISINNNGGCINPECVLNSDCPNPNQACKDNRCVLICSEQTCGVNAICEARNHIPSCSCLPGYVGDPSIQCSLLPDRDITTQSDPCNPSPCPLNVQCVSYDNKIAICDNCALTHTTAVGVPSSCRRECLRNSDCSNDLSCQNNRCVDPCRGACGLNTYCNVAKHRAICRCVENMVGDPYNYCDYPPPSMDPQVTCNNIVCGSNAECNQRGKIFKCVCSKGFYGDPLVGCTPQCRLNSECSDSKACINDRCSDPCVTGACAQNAICKVKNHRPICTCPPNFTGNAYYICNEIPLEEPFIDQGNPCNPSPCGSNSKCLISQNGVAACSCLDHMIGTPPNCRPECISSNECDLYKSCSVHQRCVDPCLQNVCGTNAKCVVTNHNPICSCPSGYSGNPFVSCQYLEPVENDEEDHRDPCNSFPPPCGPYSICEVRQKRPVCSCLPNMIGKPPSCRPQCLVNSECPLDQYCSDKNRCENACGTSICGQNTQCNVVNHVPICGCLKGYRGDAFVGCVKDDEVRQPDTINPCEPSPCAQNTECTIHNGNQYTCSCIPPYRGDPYSVGCKPECVSSFECDSSKSCINSRCVDPCIGVCGRQAICNVVQHVASCQCPDGMFGNPFDGCRIRDTTVTPQNPCERSTCGPNSLCRVVSGRAACSCLPNMRGSPPNCRPECVTNSECDLSKSCSNEQRCEDPCKKPICGLNAECRVVNHNPICNCPTNYVGDPFSICTQKRKFFTFILLKIF